MVVVMVAGEVKAEAGEVEMGQVVEGVPAKEQAQHSRAPRDRLKSLGFSEKNEE